MEDRRLLSKMRTGQKVTFDMRASCSDSIRFVLISGIVEYNIKNYIKCHDNFKSFKDYNGQ